MEYRINHQAFQGSYTREQVQELIDNKSIGPDTKIWGVNWPEWKDIKDTDFNVLAVNNSQQNPKSGTFMSIDPYLGLIDSGNFFKKVFSGMYILLAVVNILIPIAIFVKAVDSDVFDLQGKYVLVFVLIWLTLAVAAWLSFQLWQKRRLIVANISPEGDEFVVTAVFSHFIKTLGEWLGTWIGFVGFFVTLFTLLFLEKGNGMNEFLGLNFLKGGLAFLIILPIYGFLIIVITRFLSEQIKAIVSIVNNTKKKD
jgi:hypothetical protein